MTRRLKHEIGLKRTYRKIKNRESPLRGRYVEVARSVKNTRLAKRYNEIRVDNEVKSDPKGFFKFYRTKTREKFGQLKRHRRIRDWGRDE